MSVDAGGEGGGGLRVHSFVSTALWLFICGWTPLPENFPHTWVICQACPELAATVQMWAITKKFQENPRIIPLLCAFFCFCNHPASQSARFKMVWTLVWSLWLENIDLNKNHSELTYAIIICKSNEVEFEPHTNAFVSARCRWSQITLVIFLCWEEKDPGALFLFCHLTVSKMEGVKNTPLSPAWPWKWWPNFCLEYDSLVVKIDLT